MKTTSENILIKYPRTKHIVGSGLSQGDDDKEIVPFSELAGKYLVVEEKIDGANSGISFDKNLKLFLQCRGHFLLGSNDWPQFDQFKVWGRTWDMSLAEVLLDRYIMYGEWMSTMHSVYYDMLPHLFMEFDIYDKETETFLDTLHRTEMCLSMGMNVEQVRVIKAGVFSSMEEILALIGKSAFVSESSVENLKQAMREKNIPQREQELLLKLNQDQLMEGLYIKREEDGIVKDRYKYVRPDFVQTILSYDKHWLDRPSIPNQMKSGCDMFSTKG